MPGGKSHPIRYARFVSSERIDSSRSALSCCYQLTRSGFKCFGGWGGVALRASESLPVLSRSLISRFIISSDLNAFPFEIAINTRKSLFLSPSFFKDESNSHRTTCSEKFEILGLVRHARDKRRLRTFVVGGIHGLCCLALLLLPK